MSHATSTTRPLAARAAAIRASRTGTIATATLAITTALGGVIAVHDHQPPLVVRAAAYAALVTAAAIVLGARAPRPARVAAWVVCGGLFAAAFVRAAMVGAVIQGVVAVVGVGMVIALCVCGAEVVRQFTRAGR